MKFYRYRGRGHFLDPPTVCMSDDIWEVALPQKMQSGKSGHECLSFSSRDEIFKRSRDGSKLASLVLLSPRVQGYNRILEASVIQGAGGMQMIDPLYQRILVRECKHRKIPVIFDEVFTGFWRLGRELKALLHGHSYSAHAMGCAAAVKSVKWFKDSNTNMNLISESRSLQELWDAALVSQISLLPAVHRVVALGTLCAIELLAEGCDAGYASMYASSLLKNLREDGIYMRPLGNVIYMMCGPCTSPDICRSLLEKVYDRIQEFGLQKDESAVFAA
ncbi:UNVERIFIED_CONTAM: Bifunctional dethiobiotin synthetase/7,8-diamino-pelargonic acid aminotransferase, mitochondrial [Sesamum latifolium]|uniref:Bifunctional dethiobiotin synthetase/7,8-diamino-pelargonic acid aminotransferase, mitochondrial n=1 Tax=Sesamum latifolium TaxID=2727402 RepID=A0AAW2XNQ8_9LAMI